MKATSLCLGNVSKDFLTDNMKKDCIIRYVYVFPVDFNSIINFEYCFNAY